jgi:hypothetical protein
MVQGQKNRVWIPEKLLKKRPGQPDGMLVYEFKVVALQKMTDPPPVPKDVAAPPADAKKTAKGVSYKVLKKGSGTEHPTAAKTVTVHYTGWTTDGRMFDSSVVRDKPSEFPLSNVIPGWTDGIQVMAVGDQARFWIPKEMAYDGKPGRPQGMLVFDIELLEIKDTPKRRPMPGHVRGPGGVNLPGGMNLPNRGGKAHGGPGGKAHGGSGGKAHGGSGGKGRKPGMVPQQPPAPAQ